jgi:sulfonate transport system substrate-binding protein
MAKIISKWYLWGLGLLLGLSIIGVVVLLKPAAHTVVQPANRSIAVLRIALPDLSSNTQHSSGTVLLDYIYLNQLLEQKLAAQNIKVEWHFFKGAGPAINEALVNHQVDVAFLGDLALIIGKANHIDTKLIAAVTRQVHSYLGVLPNRGYHSLEQLKGKSIAVWQGTAAHLSFAQFIQQRGYSEKDFRIVNLDAAAANSALAAQRVDAGWGLMNILALAQKKLVEIPLSTVADPQGVGTIQMGLIAQTQLLQAHPELIQALVNTLVEAAYWASQAEHREQGIQLVSSNAGYPTAIYRASLDGQALKDVYNPRLDRFFVGRLQAGIETALQSNLIKQGFDLQQWLEPSFVNQAIKQLKYEHYWP